jgi:hypothetical protein
MSASTDSTGAVLFSRQRVRIASRSCALRSMAFVVSIALVAAAVTDTPVGRLPLGTPLAPFAALAAAPTPALALPKCRGEPSPNVDELAVSVEAP